MVKVGKFFQLDFSLKKFQKKISYSDYYMTFLCSKWDESGSKSVWKNIWQLWVSNPPVL